MLSSWILRVRGSIQKLLEQLGALKVTSIALSFLRRSIIGPRYQIVVREKGYEIRRIQPFDMFPQTAHLETLVELVIGLTRQSNGPNN